ncbi:hypothetical protein ACO0QE_004725 [Hanseniaspora vineae]
MLSKDVEQIHKSIFVTEDPKKANQQCNKLLLQKGGSQNAMLLAYKSIALLKLYFGSKVWKTNRTLTNIFRYLMKSLILVETQASADDQEKKNETLGFIHFRFALLYYHLKQFGNAKSHLDIATKIYLYNLSSEPSLSTWEYTINEKLKTGGAEAGTGNIKLDVDIFGEDDLQEDMQDLNFFENTESPAEQEKQEKQDIQDSLPAVVPETQSFLTAETEASTPKFKVDWYQTPQLVTVSLFTAHPPKSKDSVSCTVTHNQYLEVSYPNPDSESNSEFQYNVKLAFKVAEEIEKVFVGTKKMEVTLRKLKSGHTWKTLEFHENQTDPSVLQDPSSSASTYTIKSPYTSKVDWNKFGASISDDNVAAAPGDPSNVEMENGGQSEGGVETFFQQLYKDADPDTKRAMMKSFLESNGTALSTDWQDVKDKKVETTPPDGMEAKKW